MRLRRTITDPSGPNRSEVYDAILPTDPPMTREERLEAMFKARAEAAARLIRLAVELTRTIAEPPPAHH